jgi:hypothetical protein
LLVCKGWQGAQPSNQIRFMAGGQNALCFAEVAQGCDFHGMQLVLTHEFLHLVLLVLILSVRACECVNV